MYWGRAFWLENVVRLHRTEGYEALVGFLVNNNPFCVV